MPPETPNAPPLTGIRVLDLSRILAGPTATQLLADLGAEVWKVEHPQRGDDTRRWGPPYLSGAAGEDLESAYFISANRNKRSLAIDLATPAGGALVRELAAQADVFVENFKVGGLAKYGLAYSDLRESCPRVVYCSITGFGQTGPRSAQTGYDFLVQAMGGIMSLTGPPEGPPYKAGVGVADVVCGLYATVGILSALHHRDRTGVGQHIDLALYDAQVSWLVNAAANYLVTGRAPARRGNAHPHIVPYQLFSTADGHVAVAAGNDAQFERLCHALGADDVTADSRFATNSGRVQYREDLVPQLELLFAERSSAYWVQTLLEAQVPCGEVQDLEAVFSDAHTHAREMRVSLSEPRAESGRVEVVGNPLKFSETPVSIKDPPPPLGRDTDEVLRTVLGRTEDEIAELRRAGAIG